jgi:hypothetical protein
MTDTSVTYTCPECHQSDKCAKVSVLYVEASGNRKILNIFSPPSGKTETIRDINPDIVVIGFSIVAGIFLYNIYATQPQYFPMIAAVTGLAYVGYIVLRKKIMGKYKANIQAKKDEKDSIERAIEHWLKLVYCARDKVVFDPEENIAVPAGQMRDYLMGKYSPLEETEQE